MDYKNKYLKYKLKYLITKTLTGGAEHINNMDNNIVRQLDEFVDSDDPQQYKKTNFIPIFQNDDDDDDDGEWKKATFAAVILKYVWNVKDIIFIGDIPIRRLMFSDPYNKYYLLDLFTGKNIVYFYEPILLTYMIDMQRRQMLIHEFDFIDHILTFCKKPENINEMDEVNRNRLITFIIYCIDKTFNIDFIYKMIMHLKDIDICKIVTPDKKREIYRQNECYFDELKLKEKEDIDNYLVGYVVPPDTP